jgi:hypothetical protein
MRQGTEGRHCPGQFYGGRGIDSGGGEMSGGEARQLRWEVRWLRWGGEGVATVRRDGNSTRGDEARVEARGGVGFEAAGWGRRGGGGSRWVGWG